jgi:hypothetical protein
VSDGSLTDSQRVKVKVNEVSTSTPTRPSSSSRSSGGGGGGGGGGGPIGGFGGNLTQPVILWEISYDICDDNNWVRITAGTYGNLAPPFVKLRTGISGVFAAKLIENQPYTEFNKVSPLSKYVYETKVDPDNSFFIVNVEEVNGRWLSQVSQTVNIYGCKDTIVISKIEDYVTGIPEQTFNPNSPQVFDIKYQVGENPELISPDTLHQFIRGDQPIVISGIISSPSPLTRAELRTITAGESIANYAAVKMNIEPLGIENAYRVTAEVPTNFIHSPGLSLWIHATNEKDLVQDSKMKTIGVKRGGGFDIRIELDSFPNQAIGTLYRPTAYVFSNDIPVYGSISLLVNDQIVYTSPEQVFDSNNPSVVLEWKIPKEMPDSMLHGTSLNTNDSDEPGFFELVGRALRNIFSFFIGEDPKDKELSTQETIR